MSYQDKAETTREYYRKQGEQREKERIKKLLEELLKEKPAASWSPNYLMSLIND